MNAPHEQHAQYLQTIPAPRGGHLAGHTLVLTRRPANAPARQTEHLPRQGNPVPRGAHEPGDEGLAASRVPKSALPYAVAAPQGQTRLRVQHHPAPAKRRASQDFPAPRQRRQAEPRRTSLDRQARKARLACWLKRLGIGMLIAFFGGILLSQGFAWSGTVLDGWRYGNPRTSQTDAVVGHQDSALFPSHFMAENLHRHIFVIELVGGNPAHAVTYVGPVLVGPGQDLSPVTVSFADVTHDGKPDMLLHIQDSTLIYVNTGKSFRPVTPADHVTL